ncbi:PIR protein [Plasmodium ovale]|uniref:PIR Superfamily Protein n=2 Tax=Plasmodium ovale TaxID=36330 RepID=A0A1A8WED2_PLAOA|nr:PIR Superfamily Protein [Plasmodium ovale curtisi]SBT83998.1 PIR protein [Plasmodium ovale]
MTDPNDFKNHLKSVEHYKYLDNDHKFAGNPEACALLRNKFPNKNEIYDFCLSLRGNLDYFSNLRPLNLFKDDNCQYLNCWINDRLLSLGFNVGGNSANIIIEILRYFTFFEVDKTCKYEFSHIEKKQYEKMKTLYDYVLDFSNIQWYANKYGCSTENEQYINERRRVYEEVIEDCKKPQKETYCIVLKHLQEAYRNNELLNFRCTKFKDHSSRDTGRSRMLQSGQNDGSGEFHGALGSENDHQRVHSSASVEETEESSLPSSTTPMAVLFPFLGSSLILFILYRFSPMGHWLRTRFLRKNMVRSNIDEDETVETIQNAYEMENISPQISRHLIGYNPLENM